MSIFYFHPYLGKIPILTNIFQMGWNHQLGVFQRSAPTRKFLAPLPVMHHAADLWIRGDHLRWSRLSSIQDVESSEDEISVPLTEGGRRTNGGKQEKMCDPKNRPKTIMVSWKISIFFE